MGWKIALILPVCVKQILFLRNIEVINSTSPILQNKRMLSEPSDKFYKVLVNPHFVNKSSFTETNDDGVLSKEVFTYNRQDFWVPLLVRICKPAELWRALMQALRIFRRL